MKGEYEVKRAFLVTIVATLLLSFTALSKDSVSAESIHDLKEKINQHENEKSNIKEKKSGVNSDKRNTESKIDENIDEQKSVEQEILNLEEKLSKTENDISAKENDIQSTNKEIDELNEKIDALVEEIAILKDKIEKRNILLKDRLRALQKNGGSINFIQVIFDSKSFSDFISRAAAVNTIMDQDKTIMEEQAADRKLLKENKKEVEEKKTVVVAKKDELENQKKELVALKGQMDDQKSERKTLMAKLEKEQDQLEEIKLTLAEEQEILSAEEKAQEQAIALAEQKVGELEQQAREKAEAERKKREAEQRKAAKEAKSETKVARSPEVKVDSNPVSGAMFTHPASGPITSGFGMRTHPIFNVQKLHRGVDFAVGEGTSLVAPADGVVSVAEKMGGFGNVIMISHHIDGKDITTVCAHLSDIQVSAGQAVSRGQTIGKTGNTGDSTGPHLHFEVHPGGYGNAVNPMPYLQ